MRTLASGWCPKDDRVYQHADRCPDCGTALIPLEPPLHAETAQEIVPQAADTPIDERPPIERPPTSGGRRWPRRLAIVLALLAAFGLGSVLPEDETPTGEAPIGAARETNLRDQIARAPGGATLFLSRVVQSSSAFTAVFSPGPGSPDARLIEDAAVEVTIGMDDSERTFSVSDVSVSPIVGGFTITGKLPSPTPIRQLRISSIQVRDPAAPEWGANISSMWPVGADEPRVLRLPEAPRPVERGSIRLASLIGWRDRMEAVFELLGDDGTPGNRSEMVGLELLTSTPNSAGTLVGRAIAASDVELVSAGQLIARFESLPDNAGPIVIRATRLLSFVGGPWTWRLP
ncbi:MAG: hypothetical protein ACRDKG_07700 [Actinomycetota bacterium]